MTYLAKCTHTSETVTASGLCAECERKYGIDTLAAMTGSEKQVAWAEDIRRDAIQEIAEICSIRARKMHVAYEIPEMVQVVLREMAKEADAKWWIDNRNNAKEAMARKVAGK